MGQIPPGEQKNGQTAPGRKFQPLLFLSNELRIFELSSSFLPINIAPFGPISHVFGPLMKPCTFNWVDPLAYSTSLTFRVTATVGIEEERLTWGEDTVTMEIRMERGKRRDEYE